MRYFVGDERPQFVYLVFQLLCRNDVTAQKGLHVPVAFEALQVEQNANYCEFGSNPYLSS